jgi:two-component system LytT family response regulator
MPPVIFVTTFDRFAVQALEVNAVDYLLKPFDFEWFEIAFKRMNTDGPAIRNVKETLIRLLQQMDQKMEFRQRLPIKENERIVLLPVQEIEWIKADGKYVLIHAKDSNHHMRITLRELEARLDPAKFVRIRRSHIINIDYINEHQIWFHGDYNVILKNGTGLRLNRRYNERLLDIF